MALCDQYTQLNQAITGSYSVFYSHPNPDGSNSPFNEVESYLGNVKAGTLNVSERVSSTDVFGDVYGEDEPIDRILGPATDRITFTLLEVNRLAVRRLIWPWATNSTGTTLLPGRSGEKPYPGAIASRYEGRLRLRPLSGNVAYWDDDLNLETIGLNIRNYHRVLVDPASDMVQNFNAKLLELPIVLLARPCYDTAGNKYSTHNYVNSITAA